MINNKISIYVHWPFCLSKCPYCDFNSHVAFTTNHSLWLEAYKKELHYFDKVLEGKYIQSIFFGGGTPSLMEPSTVEGIIKEISKIGLVDDLTEITLETNPTSFEVSKFMKFRTAGVNRISIGVQSLRASDLEVLGRQHDVNQAISSIEHAKKIFPRISFDLIYARHNQTLKEWQIELQEAMEIAAGHISLYQLTIEKGTLYYNMHKNKQINLPLPEVAADMYEWTTSFLNDKNYNRYEISNYAQSKQESIHNLAYWNYNEYLGIGPGAHSRLRNFNQVNSNNNTVTSIMMKHKPEIWLTSVNNLSNGIQNCIQLTKQDIITEFFMMGLRLKKGINFADIKNTLNVNIYDVIDADKVNYYSDLGLVSVTEDNICLTGKGLMLHNYLVPNLLLDVGDDFSSET
ncbi:MAG: coproporphyrinogen III oxidase [Rickettsiaceae bacterium]|nr:MAG: coproporphyrinogen III oxidase [Rickettsiaceae bacterium]